MREIKFRAWDGHKIHYPTNFEFGISGVNGLTSIAFVPFGSLGYTTTAHIQQYTGLKDKNGREIYEGDILTLGYSLNQGQWSKYGDCKVEVIWKPDKAGFYPFTNFTDIEYTIVIGNIYENPELCKTMQTKEV